MSQDDDGKIWWACGGCETGYVNFEIPIQYGALPRLADQTEAGFETVWPIAGVSDTQGGMGRVRVPLGVLNHFTAGAGIDVVRADRLPADLSRRRARRRARRPSRAAREGGEDRRA